MSDKTAAILAEMRRSSIFNGYGDTRREARERAARRRNTEIEQRATALDLRSRGLTLAEAGEVMSLSGERVRQLAFKARDDNEAITLATVRAIDWDGLRDV